MENTKSLTIFNTQALDSFQVRDDHFKEDVAALVDIYNTTAEDLSYTLIGVMSFDEVWDAMKHNFAFVQRTLDDAQKPMSGVVDLSVVLAVVNGNKKVIQSNYVVSEEHLNSFFAKDANEAKSFLDKNGMELKTVCSLYVDCLKKVAAILQKQVLKD